MKYKVHTHRRGWASVGLGTGLLAIGILLGFLWRPLLLSYAKQKWDQSVAWGRQLMADTSEFKPGKLPLFEIEIEPTVYAWLATSRQSALEKGVIPDSAKQWFEGQLRVDGEPMQVDMRLKGDWVDHLTSEKWSLRFDLKDQRLMGMRRFSIQNPATRGFLWEWFIHRTAVNMGILAPRADFVRVSVNGIDKGVYFLEEHFSKEMLESQSRREGPIVIFDEEAVWPVYLEHHQKTLGKLPEIPFVNAPAMGPERAGVRGFQQPNYADKARAGQYQQAVEKMMALRDQLIAASHSADRLEKLRALKQLQGQTIDQLLDTTLLGRHHALLTLFQSNHGTIWHNMRFYHNPLSDRLEPINFDNMADLPSFDDLLIHSERRFIQQLRHSQRYGFQFFESLGRICSPQFLDNLFAELEKDALKFEAAMRADDNLPESHYWDAMKQRLRTRQLRLRDMLAPNRPMALHSKVHLEREAGAISGWVEISAWATSRIPVLVEGFRFEDGRLMNARATLLQEDDWALKVGESVLLPDNGTPITFRFPINTRLASLENVAQLKNAIRMTEVGSSTAKLDDIQIRFRAAGNPVWNSRMLEPMLADQQPSMTGRPNFPTMAEALQTHPFLLYEFQSDRLFVKPGDWTVSQDLVVPEGYRLYARAGTRLRFQPNTMLLSAGPLDFRGAADDPIVLEAADRKSWGGLMVMQTQEPSFLAQVTIRQTDRVNRGGWQTTGGITFYHSPLEMRDCLIDGTLAEDGLNVFGTNVTLDRVTFRNCLSDSFDGDFVTGVFRACHFEDGAADGLDFSGSDVDVLDCVFERLQDKAISVGEDTVCRIRGGTMRDVSIGLAAKDASVVEIHDISIFDARNYALAVYIKKPVFGPSKVTATNTTIVNPGRAAYIVQDGSSLSLDGRQVETRKLNVAQLYQEQILGN